jgi:peptide chain release factor subunit 3
VLCARRAPCPAVTYFDAQLQILDLLEHKAIFTAGYKCILHVHAVVEECEITALLAQVDPKTREKKRAKFVKSGAVAIARVQVAQPICVELFDAVPQLGRFTLRDEGRTIAIGKIIRLPKKPGGPGAAGGGGGGGGGGGAE